VAAVVTVITILFLLAVVVVLVVGVRRMRLSQSDYGPYDEGLGDDDAGAGVREPRRPPPTSGAATAMAELDEHAA
jgi:hypothetical protein